MLKVTIKPRCHPWDKNWTVDKGHTQVQVFFQYYLWTYTHCVQ